MKSTQVINKGSFSCTLRTKKNKRRDEYQSDWPALFKHMNKRNERDENRPEKNVKEKRSTTHKDGLEYPFWWTPRTAQLSNRLLFHHKTSVSVDTKPCWILKREHPIIGANPFQVLKKLEGTEEMKEVKHFAKRGEDPKITEVMRSRKIEVKLSEDQKKQFRYWSDVHIQLSA
jgi:hypothetical protein